MANIKDVAKQAGVSIASVSRVLAGRTGVGKTTRQRVLKAIQALDYRPDLSAQRLRSRRTDTIGLIVSDIRNPFFTEISRAVEDITFRHGLRLILCNSDEDPAKEQAYLELMADEQASGVILSATLERLRRPPAETPPFPVVLVDRVPVRGDGPLASDSVVLDNTGAARRLAQHLLDNGYQRLAALVGNRSNTGRERQAGFEAVLRERGLQLHCLPLPPTAADARAATQTLLSGPDRPDALLASSGLLLLGALQAVQGAGLRLPDDIALAGFDNNDWTALTQPGITVIAQPTQDIGRTAGELLLQRMAEPARPARRVVLDGELLMRGSSAQRSS